MLLSSPPSPEDSRLACLNRIPIAVAAGRINRSQIFDFSSLMDERNWQFTMFHRCPAKRHTQSNDPSNGTFVASNVRIHECTPFGGDHDSPSSQAASATRAFPCISKRYISLVIQAVPRETQARDLDRCVSFLSRPPHRAFPCISQRYLSLVIWAHSRRYTTCDLSGNDSL